MSKSIDVTLGPTDVSKFISPYLTEGRKNESWELGEIIVKDKKLSTTVSISSTYKSATDDNQFHLTIFATLEFLSQLFIIYGHVWAGLKEKQREAWMVESNVRSVSAIRDNRNINVEMTIPTMRKRGDTLYGVCHSKVTDSEGGLFEVTLKAFLG